MADLAEFTPIGLDTAFADTTVYREAKARIAATVDLRHLNPHSSPPMSDTYRKHSNPDRPGF